jgi:hypothetical protein
MNSHGALRSMRYHAITMFAYMSDIIAGPVIKSTIGYFKSVMVRYSCTHKSRLVAAPARISVSALAQFAD